MKVEWQKTYEWMKCMNSTSAYTGIASDTPVGVHLGPHITKCGDPRPVWRTFHTGIQICPHWNGGSYVPILELMGLYIPLPWVNHEPWMNEYIWICKKKTQEAWFTYMKRGRSQRNLLTYHSTQSWHELKTLWTIDSSTSHNVLAHIGIMGLHYPLPWVNRSEGTNECKERSLIIEESWYINYEGKQGIPKLPISYSSIKWNKQQTRQINCTCLNRDTEGNDRKL